MTTPPVGPDGVDAPGSPDSGGGDLPADAAAPVVVDREDGLTGVRARRFGSRVVAGGAVALLLAGIGTVAVTRNNDNSGEAQGASSAFVPASCPPGMSTNTCQNLRLKALEDNAAGVAPSSSPSATPSASPTPTVTVTASPTPSSSPSATFTPSPTPTTTPTPTPPPAGFPGAGNTGVPPGTTLTASGGVTVTVAGTVLDGRAISGTVNINASNVTIKRSTITGSSFGLVRIKEGVTGVRLEDVTVNGLGNGGTAGSNCVWGPVFILRANILGCENGATLSSGSTLKDSWLHALTAPGSPHIDGVQLDGGISNVAVTHNNIEMGNGAVSAVMTDNYFGSLNNIAVDGNRLTGGQYTVSSDGSFGSAPITNTSFTNNTLGRGVYGYSLIRGTGASGVGWSGNTDATSGAVVNK